MQVASSECVRGVRWASDEVRREKLQGRQGKFESSESHFRG